MVKIGIIGNLVLPGSEDTFLAGEENTAKREREGERDGLFSTPQYPGAQAPRPNERASERGTMSSTKRKSAILQNARSQHRGSVMLTPQQRLNNFKQTVSSANVAVSEKSQVVRQKISKNLEKRKKKLLNAQMLLQNLGEVSGINDTNLLYGEKPPMGDDNSLMMTDKPYLKDTTQGGVGAQDPNLKPKKDLRYKLKSFKRRTEQKVLETFGKSPQRKLKETEFDTMWEKVFTQEQVWRELKVRCKDLMKMMQNIGDLGSEISELLIELCKDDSDGSDDGSDNAGYQTLPLLKLQYSLDTIAKDTIPRVVDEQLNDTVCQPLTEWKDEFPSYQACLQPHTGRWLCARSHRRHGCR